MDKRILRVLEFQKIIDQLVNQAATALGKDLSSKLFPSIEITEVRRLQAETSEAAEILRLNLSIPFGGIVDIRESLKRSVIGGVLSANACLDVSQTIFGGRQVKDFLENIEADLPILKGFTADIMPLRELEQLINQCIDDHGHVMDSASTKLRSIRSSIRTYESRIREKLDSYVRSNSNMLSDAIVTIRNDRYVLPVKHEYRGAIGGIVHDQSASGQTLFMEPGAIVDLNNEVQEQKLKEGQEIDRILRELSAEIAESASYLEVNVEILADLDFIHARAKLGNTMKATTPKMNDRGYINMKQARHPLIAPAEVVPNDVELGDTYSAIVITGPNTGGKTVTLKMVGLCTLMAQSGLQVPALDDCELAVFDNVFADIGDEQSIEQSLSTFSSHMTNIVRIIDEVDANTLVLFDELGSGTDPQEGAALAMSILDEIVGRNARIIATTHYPELKAYSYNRENVINASVEFNVETLKPTYRLLIGVPGRSNAFEISKRLGLNERVIDHARGYMDIESESMENMIVSLETARKKAEKDYENANIALKESEVLKAALEKELQEFEQKRERLYKKAEEKAEKALQQAREEAELIISEIRGMKTNATLKEHEWIEAKKMLEEAQPNLSSKEKKSRKPAQKTVAELQPGDEVMLLTFNQKANVIEKVSATEYFVQVGAMKLKVKQQDLELLEKQKETKKRSVTTTKGTSFVRTELDLRGERYDAALIRVEKYIDNAVLQGYPHVSIIHGKGTGALRQGVQALVQRHPNVATSRPGEPGEGGSGVTVIELR